jgi:hypothetical protein
VQQDDLRPGETKSLLTIRLVSAGAFMSLLVATDLLFSLFCSSWSLLFYLAVAGSGAWKGERLHRRFSADTTRATFVRRFGVVLALFSALGLVVLLAMPVHWDSKCAWRYCGRAMGPGLLESPFPVGTPSCGAWMKCANEFQYSPKGYRDLLERMEEQGCPAP